MTGMEREIRFRMPRKTLGFLNGLVPTLEGLISATVRGSEAVIRHDAVSTERVDGLIAALGGTVLVFGPSVPEGDQEQEGDHTVPQRD